MAEVHWDGLIIKCWRGVGRVNWRHPVSDRVTVSGGVGWRPTPHSLLEALKESWGRLSSLRSCIPPVSSIWSSKIALGSEHVLDDLAGPGHVNGFLFHFLVACWKGGFHDFSSDGSGEALKEKVGALIVS